MSIQIAGLVYRGFWTALDWIFPPVCAGCGEPGYRLCVNCKTQIKFIEGNICEICGQPWEKAGGTCKKCELSPPPYDALRSVAMYEGVIRECIHSLKYDRNQSLGEYFSREMIERIDAMNWSLDLVIPVPLSPFRIKERGYNQSALFARPIALGLSLPYKPYGLERIRNTKSQVELTVAERRQNVAGAFQAEPEIVRGKNVLLIDDVTTTGSTINECTKALKAGGAKAVFCVTLARPIHEFIMC